MKKYLIGLLLIIMLLSCGKKQEELNLLTWTYFVPDSIIEGFEKETGIKVNVSNTDTNDTMLAKLLSGTSDYDIVTPSTDFIQPLIKLDLIKKLDKSKLHNAFDNLNPEINFNEVSKGYDEGLNYTIPYMLFATGITVNKNNVKPGYVRDLEIFLDENYKSRMSMLDDSRETLGLVLQHLGYESNSENEEELEKAKEFLIKIKPNLAKFDNNVYSENIVTGELYIAHGYADAFYLTDDEDSLDFFLPSGALMYIDNMAITKNGKNSDNAYKFLEYLYRPENYSKFLNEYRTISVISGIDQYLTNKPILSLEEINKKSQLPTALSEKAKQLHSKIWTEIKLAK